jgi:hypothetical protein
MCCGSAPRTTPRLVILLGVPPDESLHLYSLLLRLCCCFAALAAHQALKAGYRISYISMAGFS